MGRPNPSGHPARYSESIVAYLKTQLDADMHVHDPFAGTGEFLGALADEIGFEFSGTEIEQCFIRDKRVKVGDSTKQKTYPKKMGWVGVTSPVYPNGVADNFASSENEVKPWKRNTYRHAVVAATGGQQTELLPNDMGAFGYRGTSRDGRSLKRQAYWDLACSCMFHWDTARMFILNVSDFVYSKGGEDYIEPVTQDWVDLMGDYGWKMHAAEFIVTPRYGNASDDSRDQRMDSEAVVTFTR